MFPVGSRVTVVNQPIKIAWIGDELFLEASPTVEQSVKMEEMGQVPEQKLSNEEMKRIIKAAGAYQDRLNWPTIRKAVKERNSYPVAIARRPSVTVQEDQVVETGDVPEEAKDLLEPGLSKKSKNPSKAKTKSQRQSAANQTERAMISDNIQPATAVAPLANSRTRTLNP
jgi:hypothetical protein